MNLSSVVARRRSHGFANYKRGRRKRHVPERNLLRESTIGEEISSQDSAALELEYTDLFIESADLNLFLFCCTNQSQVTINES